MMSRIFGATRQLGLVVRDFDATLEHWTRVQGVGPFYCFRATPVAAYRYRGAPAEAPVLSIALGYSGALQIEIIHQHNAVPSIYRDFLQSGREGLHHISSFTDGPGFVQTVSAATAAGRVALCEGSIGGVRFAYFDTDVGAGTTTCEVSESDMDGPRQIFAMIRAAADNWDGAAPVRPLALA
jgi:hypothetical protein